MIAYLAGPITAVGREAAMKREVALRLALAEEGITTFAPACAWLTPDCTSCPGIQHVDDAAIAVCDVVVVTYLDGVESPGTDHEIELALSLGKSILVYAPEYAPNEGWERARAWRARLGVDPSWVATISAVVVYVTSFQDGDEWSS